MWRRSSSTDTPFRLTICRCSPHASHVPSSVTSHSSIRRSTSTIEYSGSDANNTTKQARVTQVEVGGTPSLNNEASLGPWIDKNDILYISKPSDNSSKTNFIIDSAESSNDPFNSSIKSDYWRESPGLTNGSIRLTGSGR